MEIHKNAYHNHLLKHKRWRANIFMKHDIANPRGKTARGLENTLHNRGEYNGDRNVETRGNAKSRKCIKTCHVGLLKHEMLRANNFLKHDIANPRGKPLGAREIPYTIGEKLMATEMLKHGETRTGIC